MKSKKINDIPFIHTWEKIKVDLKELNLKYHITNGKIYILKLEESHFSSALCTSTSVDVLEYFIDGYKMGKNEM